MNEFAITAKKKRASPSAAGSLTKKNSSNNTQLQSANATHFNFASLTIQPKLRVSQSEDPYEQEADRVAEKIMKTPANVANGIATDKEVGINRKCAACEMDKQKEEKDLKISRKTADSGFDEVANEISHVRSGESSSLDGNTRQFMESRFRYDFGSVRIHSGERAARSAKSIHALAYTVENDIVFDEGQYDTHSHQGLKLLAHELVHVVQQNRGHGAAVQRTPSADSAEGEQREFVRMTVRFLNESAEYFGDERVTIDPALFERLINSWYVMVEDRERMISSQLGGDALLKRELRDAYTAAIRVLMRRAASALGRSERDLYRENTGRIPMWAWLTPHHMELGISTPMAEGRTADILTGEVNFTANGIHVTIAPDTTDPSITGAETSINFATGSINWVSNRQGRRQVIASFTGPGIPAARIQTKYGMGVSSASISGYGRGTTREDIAGGRVNPRSTTLGFHEGHHGLDYVEFLENNAPPQFTGTIGMTVAQFNAAITQWQADWRDYNDRANAFSKGRTDCVGTMTIDQYNQANAAPGATITLHCTP